MLATKKWKERGRWTAIVTIESLRCVVTELAVAVAIYAQLIVLSLSACIRLFLLLQTRGAMLIQQTIPQRDVLLGRTRNGPLTRTSPTSRRCVPASH